MTRTPTGTPTAARRPAQTRGPLDVFFEPETVAVFGASQNPTSVGRAVMANLLRSPFGGTIYPISPKWATAHGVKAYPSLAEAPAPVELAILAVPAPLVPAVLEECAAGRVRGAIILSDAFREGDPARAELARWVRERARQGPMRVLGPNSMGVASARTGFNATFASAMIPPGAVGFVSQSGSILTGLTSGGLASNVGCSAFVSLGSMIDVGWADCIEYLGKDARTERIGIYVESIGDPESFVAAVRKVTSEKPVIAVHGGRTAAGARAAASHSGSRPEKDELVEETLRRAGVIRVDSIDELFRMVEILGTQPTPRGGRLTMLTNAGGPAVVATDALAADGGDLAELTPDTVAELDRLAPNRPGRRNPIDLGDDATPEQFARAAEIAARDPNSDGLLVILTPQASMDPVETARALAQAAEASRMPILASWLWGAANPASLSILRQAGVPTFPCPNAAVRVFGHLSRYGTQRMKDEG